VRRADGTVTSGVKQLGSLVVVTALVLGLVLVPVSCVGHWLTPPTGAKLLVSDPIRAGGRYEVTISVVDMPDGGVAGIELGTVAQLAIAFTHVDVGTITAEGLSGFRVTAQSYTAGLPARGCLVAVNAAAPIVSGPVLKLSFEATGDPAVTLDETQLRLANAVPAWITAWDLVTDVAYHTKEVRVR
jgi:hypothetical protein